MCFIFLNYSKINIKFTIFTIFKCTVQWHSYIHIVVPPSPASYSRTISSSQIETLSPLNNSPFSPQPLVTTILIFVSIIFFFFLAAMGLGCNTWDLPVSTFRIFSHGMWEFGSLTRDWTKAPAPGAQGLSHWITGKFLVSINLITLSATCKWNRTIFYFFVSSVFHLA